MNYEMSTIIVSSIFKDISFLGSRYSGNVLRKEILEKLDNSDVVMLDFENIEGITQAFADEVIGTFFRDYDLTFVKNKIKVINANENIRSILNLVISYSRKYGDHKLK